MNILVRMNIYGVLNRYGYTNTDTDYVLESLSYRFTWYLVETVEFWEIKPTKFSRKYCPFSNLEM